MAKTNMKICCIFAAETGKKRNQYEKDNDPYIGALCAECPCAE